MSIAYVYDGYGDLLDYATSLGFDAEAAEQSMVDAEGAGNYEDMAQHRQCDIVDAMEEEVMEFLEGKGITVVFDAAELRDLDADLP